jgi:hypothetical protein
MPVMADSAARREASGRVAGWRHPAAIALGAALAIVVASFVPTAWVMLSADGSLSQPPSRDAPWDADVAADGAVRALGLRLPGSTLGDLRTLWGDELQVALMVTQGSAASLEASVERARPGGVAGRLLVTAQADPGQLVRWQAGALRGEATSPRTRRLTLQPQDLAEALRAPVTSVGFVPQVQLDAELVRRRFGEPRQVVAESPGREHWLYPERGLALALDADGRELLQFVAPAQFEVLLRAPLMQAARRAQPPPAVRTGPG